MGRTARIPTTGLPPELDAFLDMMTAERAVATNTLQAYRRDLADAATWLAASYGPGSVGVYLACLGASTLAALILSQETRATNLDTMEQDATAAAAIEQTSP